MTVSELIQELKAFNQEARVFIFGDSMVGFSEVQNVDYYNEDCNEVVID